MLEEILRRNMEDYSLEVVPRPEKLQMTENLEYEADILWNTVGSTRQYFDTRVPVLHHTVAVNLLVELFVPMRRMARLERRVCQYFLYGCGYR